MSNIKYPNYALDYSKIQTPEFYFGNQLARLTVRNPKGFHLDQKIDNFLSSSTSSMSNSSNNPNTIYLEGKCKRNSDIAELQINLDHMLLDHMLRLINMIIWVNSKDRNESQVAVYENNSLISI